MFFIEIAQKQTGEGTGTGFEVVRQRTGEKELGKDQQEMKLSKMRSQGAEWT